MWSSLFWGCTVKRPGSNQKTCNHFLLHFTKHWFRAVNRSGFGDKFLLRIQKENWKSDFMNYIFPKMWIPNQECETSRIKGWASNKVILTSESAYTRKCRYVEIMFKLKWGFQDCKEIQPVHPKGDQSWMFTVRMMLRLKLQILATWCEDLTHWKRPWCWEGLKARREGDDRGWDSWTDLMDMSLSKFWELVMDREAWSAAIHGVSKSQNWAELN